MDKINFIDGRYNSERKKPKFIYRHLPSFSFFLITVPVVLESSRLAKKNKYDNDAWVKSSLKIKENLEKVGVEIIIEGVNNFINLEGPCVFAGNHMSTLETFFLPCVIQPYKDITFVVKKELVEIPIFKHVMKSRNPVVVGRSNPREDLLKVIDDGTAKLNEGVSIIIFPQTTRVTYFEPEEFNSIAVKLARKANVPLIPLALKTDAWANGKILKDFGTINPKKKVYFAFGEPIYIKSRGNEEQIQLVNFIKNKLDQWKDNS